MSMVTFTVLGEPLPKQSFRYSSKGRSYKDPRLAVWESRVASAASLAMVRRNLGAMSGPVRVWLEFYRKSEARADIDNLVKGVLDGLKTIVFNDDNQVVHIQAWKHHKKVTPRVVVTVQEIPPEEMILFKDTAFIREEES